MRASALAVGVLVVLASGQGQGQGQGQAQGEGTKARSSQEEKRRKLLEKIGLDKQTNSPKKDSRVVPPAPPTPPADAAEPAATDRGEPLTSTGKTTAVRAAPGFRRIIHPMLMGACSACHRAGGQAGATHLTLSGDAVVDHVGILRVVVVRDPAASALLTKAAGQTHAGGAPWPRDSSAYGRVLAWIAKGARLDAQAGELAAAPLQSPAPPMVSPVRKNTGAVPVASAPSTSSPALAATPEASAVPAASPLPPPVTSLPAAAAPSAFAGAHQILMNSCAACHRAGASAAMTRLTLSGDVTVDEASARGFLDPATPERSPLLSKATGVMHAGGAILTESDPRYAVLLAWAKPRGPAPAGPASRFPDSPADLTPSGTPAALPPPPPPVPATAAAPGRPARPHHRGVELPLGFLLNGRFDLNYERRQFSGNAFGSEGVNALRSYHRFLFLSRARADEPCGLSLEVLALTFWEAHCRVTGPSRPVALTLAGGKIVVPFGADPLYHQSYGGLAGFDQRVLPPIWAQEGVAAHAVYQRGDLVVTDDLYVVRGYGLSRAGAVVNLQNDFSPADQVQLGWGNRLGASLRGISAWYSAYFNTLGFDRHLFMQAIDVTVYRQRSIPVLGHFSLAAGLLRADVAGGGVGKDYYHFSSYFQLRYHPTDWLFLQYRQGLRSFDNRRGVILDNSRLTSADGSTHNFGVVGRYQGLSAGLFYFVILEKVDELPDDLLRLNVTYEF